MPRLNKTKTRRKTPEKKLHPKHIPGYISHVWSRSIWNKVLIVLAAALILWTGVLYGIAQWYIASTRDQPYKYGVTFIPRYAEYFGLDPQETMQAMIDDLGVRQFRLVSYWDDGEPSPGDYDFSQLDWQFAKANAVGAKVSLAIGLRQPRWPECHMPEWAAAEPMDTWSIQLKQYMKKVIERYKDNPALESYQLENEFFMTVFGICPDHSRERLVDEYNFVKTIDSSHPVIISRSNNWIGIPINEPRPDEFGISIYKRVWDKTFTRRYYEYPLPDWFYGMLAGAGKIFTGKDMIIHELQAEPWLKDGYKINDLSSLKEQDKTMTAERLKGRFEYAEGTGMKEAYLWGAEWWYWRKVKADDPSVWNAARDEFTKLRLENQKLQ